MAGGMKTEELVGLEVLYELFFSPPHNTINFKLKQIYLYTYLTEHFRKFSWLGPISKCSPPFHFGVETWDSGPY